MAMSPRKMSPEHMLTACGYGKEGCFSFLGVLGPVGPGILIFLELAPLRMALGFDEELLDREQKKLRSSVEGDDCDR